MFDASVFQTWENFFEGVSDLEDLFSIESVSFCGSTYAPNDSEHADATVTIEFQTSFHLPLVSIVQLWLEGADCYRWSFVSTICGRLDPSQIATDYDSYLEFFFDMVNNRYEYRHLPFRGSFSDFKKVMRIVATNLVKVLVHPQTQAILEQAPLIALRAA